MQSKGLSITYSTKHNVSREDAKAPRKDRNTILNLSVFAPLRDNKVLAFQTLMVLACIVFAYFQTIQGLISQWGTSEDYSYGMLIFPISLYLIWERRNRLKEAPIRTDWRALPFVLFCGIVFVLGELGAELFTTRVSMLLMVIGAVWLLFGYPVLKAVRFPLFFLFFMLPLPGMIHRNVSFPLQILSSEISVNLLRLLGFSAFREGNVIDLGISQLQVVEACSGLRFLLPLISIGVLFAFFDQKKTWERLILILMTIPIAVAANVFRIAGTGIMTNLWGSKAADGFFHAFSGWAVFMFCAAVFGIISWALSRIGPKAHSITSETTSDNDARVTRCRLSWPPLLTLVLFILILPQLVDYFGYVKPVYLKQSLSTFPHKIDQWSGTLSEMTPEIWEKVGGQEYVLIDYQKKEYRPINFYVAYYEYQRKAGDFIHSPKLCLPGAGWFITHSGERRLNHHNPSDGPAGLRFNELVVQKDGSRQLVYYWYQGRDRNFTSEYAAKFYMVWDGIFRRRTDGALVRLIMPVPDGAPLENTRNVLDHFAAKVSVILEDYLP